MATGMFLNRDLRDQIHRWINILFGFFLSISCSVKSHCQNRVADSMKLVLATAAPEKQLDLLISIGKQLSENFYDSAIHYLDRAIIVSSQTKNRAEFAEANRIRGLTEIFNGRSNPRTYLVKAYRVYDSLGNKKGIATSTNNLGLMHLNAYKQYDSALLYFKKATELFKELGDKAGEAAALNYIGIAYQYKGQFQEAVEYELRGLEVRLTTSDYRGIVYSMLNVGKMFFAAGQFQNAKEYYEKGLAFANQHDFPAYDGTYNMAYSLMCKTCMEMGQYGEAKTWLQKSPYPDHLLMGDLYLKTGSPDSAIINYKQALVESKKYKNLITETSSRLGLAKAYLEWGKFDQSISEAHESYRLADSLKQEQLKSESAGLLSTALKQKGDFKKSLFYQTIAYQIKDSLKDGVLQNKLASYEFKARLDSEQAKIKILSAEKELQDEKLNAERKTRNQILIFSGLFILSALGVALNINAKHKRIKRQNQVIEEQRNKVEMTLHELESTQSQLVQREKLASLGELTAGIAHEIQNPLNFVNNFTEVCEELIGELETEQATPQGPAGSNQQQATAITKEIKQNLAKILLHGKRADSIVKGMLQHSRTGPIQKEPTNINALAEEYLRLSYHGFRARDANFNAILETDFDPTIGKVNIVPQDISRVLLNLFNNAFYTVAEKQKLNGKEFSPRVSVSTQRNGQLVEISVKDNGMGIPEKIKDKIFQPFFTSKPTGQGTGLGLSLSYDIITKEHGGELKVTTKEKEGSEFVVSIPII